MVSFILIILASLAFTGVIIRTKSITSGRKGPGIFQPMKDLIRLFKKGAVYSKTTSFIFQVAPSIYFASVLIAIMVIPLGQYKGIISFEGDFVFFAYVLGTGEFFSIISALDTGSSFEGMGASREALFSMFAEPAFFILMGSFALLTGHTSFQEIFASLHFGSYISYILVVLATFVLAMITMVENSRPLAVHFKLPSSRPIERGSENPVVVVPILKIETSLGFVSRNTHASWRAHMSGAFATSPPSAK